ncbi:hypothetical protein FDECE_15474 [Fusarium decemcellulare]|nr:hypothetical protein FDECE_15474 [Fusarium decemcellulare]
MLPSEVLAIYRRYKQDTDSVASWLASTAKACGYPADLLTGSKPGQGQAKTPKPKTGQLRGKRRIKIKKSKSKPEPELERKRKPNQAPEQKPEQKQESKPANQSTVKHIIAIKDFLPLAKCIAGHQDPVIAVPGALFTTIDRLIALRSAFDSQLKDSGLQLDPKLDQKHGHLVGVLDAVKETLRPQMASTTEPPVADAAIGTNGDASADSTKDIGFLDKFLNASHGRPAPRDDDTASYQAEPQTSPEDVLFALTALIHDLSSIRSRIGWIWSNHRDGKFDLAAAAVATDTAVSLARGLIGEVAPLLDQQEGGAWGVLKKLYLMVCLREGNKPEEVFRNLDGDPNYDLYDIANEHYIVTFRLLNEFVEALDAGYLHELPLINEGMFGKYDANSNRDSKTGQEKFEEDKVLLMEYLPELITVVLRIPRKYPIEDEFLRGMRVLENKSTVPFSLVFAAQVFLDIHHTMRAEAETSFKAMVCEVDEMGEALEEHLDQFPHYLGAYNWPASADERLEDLTRAITWMGKNPVRAQKIKVYSKAGQNPPKELQPHRLLFYSPVMSGLYLFRLRTQMRSVGLAVANHWGSITYTAHLYNALLQEGLMQHRWPDLDVVLPLLRDSSIWAGSGRPRTVEDYARNLCLRTGIPVTAFTEMHRCQSYFNGLGGIRVGAPVSSMLSTWIFSRAEMKWSPELIKNMVTRMKGSIDDEGLKIDDRKPAKVEAPAEETDPDGFVPDELVKRLVLALDSESLEMAFPYVEVHNSCWTVLNMIKIGRLGPSFEEQKEGELLWKVGRILTAASGIDGGVRDLGPLQSAAKIVDDMMSMGAGHLRIQAACKFGKKCRFEEYDDILTDETDGSEYSLWETGYFAPSCSV